jgi:hypothetical protein
MRVTPTARPMQHHAQEIIMTRAQLSRFEQIHDREIVQRRKSYVFGAGFLLVILIALAGVTTAALLIAKIIRG